MIVMFIDKVRRLRVLQFSRYVTYIRLEQPADEILVPCRTATCPLDQTKLSAVLVTRYHHEYYRHLRLVFRRPPPPVLLEIPNIALTFWSIMRFKLRVICWETRPNCLFA